VETGSAITWKYPSCVLNGENSVGEFYSVAVTNNHQQADTGTKMIHNGKGIALDDRVEGHQRGQVEQHLSRAGACGPGAERASAISPNAIRCCWGPECGAHTVPYIEVRNPDRADRA
jgi:Fe-S cluster assembly protein SufB